MGARITSSVPFIGKLDSMLTGSRKKRALVPYFALLATLLSIPPGRGEDVNSLAKPAGYVNDYAGVIDASQKARLEDFCTNVEGQLGVQMALVTVNSTDGRDIRDYALDLFRKWGVGSKKDNQGLLLLLAVKDRKSDVEVGRGVEPYVTDGFSGSTLRAMRTDLRAGNYGAAVTAAAHSMAAQIAQGKGIAFSDAPPLPPISDDNAPKTAPRSHTRISFGLIILGIFFVIWLLSRGGGRRGGGPYRGGGGSFLTGMILGNLLGGGRGGFGGGNWGGGGGFGGGDSGGGFGGFGGGDAGGGGASSDW